MKHKLGNVNGRLPVEFVLAPDWWHQHYGISFEEPFYLDRLQRIRNDQIMRQALYERFAVGDDYSDPRPVIGSIFVAGGFVLPALFGVPIRFSPKQAPWPEPLNLSRDEVRGLHPPDLRNAWPMRQVLDDLDWLESKFGYALGDLNTGGVLDTALLIRGQELYLDFMDDPGLVGRLFSLIADVQGEVARLIQARTGTSSLSVNRSIANVDDRLYLHSNCSVQMISPRDYERFVWPEERRLAQIVPRYGIHHCGANMQLYAGAYSALAPAFCDVGWGSDVGACRRALPDSFLNLRLSPVRMLQENPATIHSDIETLVRDAGPLDRTGICCINMDAGTPDENVCAMLDTAACLRAL